MKKITIFLGLFLLLFLVGCGTEEKFPDNIKINGDTEGYTGSTIILTISPTTNHSLQWSSSNDDLATVFDGEVSLLDDGKVTISVLFDGEVKATHTINILPAFDPLNIEGEHYVYIEDTITLTITNQINSDEIIWGVSDNTIAKINDGLLTPLKSGTVIITAYSASQTQGTFEVNVYDNYNPTSIEIIIEEEILFVEGGKHKISYNVYPEYASREVIWEYNEKNVIFDEETLTVEFIIEGKSTLLCRSALDKKIVKIISLNAYHDPSVDVYRILFIGNSLTYTCDVPGIITNMARSEGIPIYVESITTTQYIDEDEVLYRDYLNKKKYSHVVLQEQSYGTYLYYSRFESAVRLFTTLAEEKGIEVILYQTWVYDLIYYNGDKDRQTSVKDIIINSYLNMASILDLKVARAGEAFWEWGIRYPDITLYRDINHQNPIGAYLSACVHFATLFNISPINNKYIYNQVEPENAEKVQLLADEIVFSS